MFGLSGCLGGSLSSFRMCIGCKRLFENNVCPMALLRRCLGDVREVFRSVRLVFLTHLHTVFTDSPKAFHSFCESVVCACFRDMFLNENCSVVLPLT